MHDYVTRPEGSMGVEVLENSKMAASSTRSGGISKIIVSFDLSKVKQFAQRRYSTAQPHQNTCRHYCQLNFPLLGNTMLYWVLSWLKLPKCTFQPRKHCFTSLCIKVYCSSKLSINSEKMRQNDDEKRHKIRIGNMGAFQLIIEKAGIISTNWYN